jgi:hypothetical protein
MAIYALIQRQGDRIRLRGQLLGVRNGAEEIGAHTSDNWSRDLSLS